MNNFWKGTVATAGDELFLDYLRFSMVFEETRDNENKCRDIFTNMSAVELANKLNNFWK